MGVTSFSYEFDCPVPPARMFKALVLDSHNLFPKLMPQAIKSVEFVQGDGGAAGSIKQTNFAEAARFKCMQERIDGIDKENFACKYTIIEGDMLNDKSVESISYEVKFEASADGGCVCRMKSEYHTVGGFEFKEEEIKAKKEKAMAMYKAVEAFLLKNPDAYH